MGAVFAHPKHEANREGFLTGQELLARVSMDPGLCFGKPGSRGHRIRPSLVLDRLSGGWPLPQLLDNDPGLAEAEVLASIAHGAEYVGGAVRGSSLRVSRLRIKRDARRPCT